MNSDLSHSLSTMHHSVTSTWQIPDTDDQLDNEYLLPLSRKYRHIDATANLALTTDMASSYAQYQSSQQAVFESIPKATHVNQEANILYAPVPLPYPHQLELYYS